MYKCLACERTWGDYMDPDGLYSHGWCSECVKKRFENKYRTEQLQFSGNPCFGAPKDYECSEITCKYREMCRSFTVFNENELNV